MRRCLRWTILAVAFLVPMGVTFVGLYAWHVKRCMGNVEWATAATPAERKVVAERSILLLPWTDPHDEFLWLVRDGDIDSVPYLLWGLRWQPEPATLCSTDHCLEALRTITGHDAGTTYADWQKWWDDEGSRLPREAFPLKDWVPPRPEDAP